jgi:hypothetical protein
MTRFKQALLAELTTRVVREAAAPIARPRRRRWQIALAGAVATGAVLAGALVFSPGQAPAYAVEKKPDGTVRLTFRDVFDVEGANRALREAGARAVVIVPGPPGSCPEHRLPLPNWTAPPRQMSGYDPATRTSWVEVSPTFPADVTAIILVQPGDGEGPGWRRARWMSLMAVRGAAPPCIEMEHRLPLPPGSIPPSPSESPTPDPSGSPEPSESPEPSGSPGS